MSIIRSAFLTLLGSTLPFMQAAPPTPPREAQILVIQHMDFGELLLEDQGGSVALTERNDLQSYSGAVRPSLRSITNEARILLRGTPKMAFTLVIDPPQPLLDNGRGANIRVASFVCAPEALRGVFNDQGEAEIHLGARLDIPALAIPGVYRSTKTRLNLSVMDTTPQCVSQFLAIQCNLRPMLHLSNNTPLDFGAIIPGHVTGIYRVHTDGQTSVSDGSGIRRFRGVPSAAEFVVTGTAGTEYCISLPTRVLLSGPGAQMQVHSFEANVPLPGILPRGGFSFRVGASLTVPADQHPGRYEGVFLVSISYL